MIMDVQEKCVTCKDKHDVVTAEGGHKTETELLTVRGTANSQWAYKFATAHY